MKDSYSLKAKREGYRARSAYKLKQINNKYHIIKEGDKVLDIGCSPGSWSQVSLEIVKEKGFVLGVDIKKIKKIKSKNFKFIQEDITKKGTLKKIKGTFNIVISDISPKTTGIINLDQELSHSLAETCLKIALKKLKPKSNFLCKIFQSNKTPELINKIKQYFKFVKTIKPESSKSKSKEMYILAKNLSSNL
jgi:23S rRNA (uridine2552-2'-O)-methyltransferase